MGHNKTVSAFIITHNRPHLLKRAIKSVINQTYPVCELIIIDDCSDERTKRVVDIAIEKYPSKIVYFRFDQNVGPCSARNKAITLAKSQFIAGLDDDDEWTFDRIEVLLRTYKKEYSFVTSRNIIVNSNNLKKIPYSPAIISLKDMLESNYAGNQILTETYKLKAIKGFDTKLSSAQDYDVYLRLCNKFGNAVCVKKPLQIIYENHSQNRISSKAKLGHLKFYFKHKALFSRNQRIAQIFRIRQISSGSVPLKYILFSSSRIIFIKMLKYIIRKTL